MAQPFIISCESTVDLPFQYVDGRGIPVLFYSYSVDDAAYPDDMNRTPDGLRKFYAFLDAGKLPTTSQLNEFVYYDFLEEQLQKGDVLHIAFGSGMTPSVNNAQKAAAQLREKYPDRRLEVVDSLCSSSGYGMLVDYAADLRDAGKSLDETLDWVMAHRQRVHHQFFSTDLKYFRRSGRVSGAAAAIGTMLNICPIMRLDDTGHIIAYDKVRGRKNAIACTVSTMLAHAEGGADYAEKCWICHSNSLDDALALKEAVAKQFPKIKGEIRLCDIGPIIASHSGPGTTAVFFLGDERQPDKPSGGK